METYDDTGWLSSVSCPDTSHCWAAGAGTTVSLVGTADGGGSWTEATAETSNEYGSVSCASVSFCVATADNGLWVTSASQAGQARPGVTALSRTLTRSASASRPVSRALPKVSGVRVAGRAGKPVVITGQFRSAPAKDASVTITLPSGATKTVAAAIGQNGYFSARIAAVPAGVTKVSLPSATGTRRTSLTVFNFLPRPVLGRITPATGPAGGGTSVTIWGTGFGYVQAIYFGSHQGSHVRVLSAREIKVTAPRGSGKVTVTVVTAGGRSAAEADGVYNY